MRKTFLNWKLYFLLLLTSILAIIAVTPYAFTLAGETIKQSPVSLPVLAVISTAQSTFIFAIVLLVGLKLSAKFNLGFPLLENYLAKQKINVNIRAFLKTAVLLGIITGVVIIALDFLFTQLGVGISLWSGQMPPFWMGILASFYGGIGEEILLRLFFMTFLIWIFSKFRKSQQNILQHNLLMWSAIIVSTLVFGLGHLPITSTVTALTPLVITRALVLNGIDGLVFGWLYWKKGLESAMLAHFSTDIIIHTIFPLLLSLTIL